MQKLFLILATSLVFLAASTTHVSADTLTTCTEHTAYVKLSPLSLTTQRLVGTLCYKGSLEDKPLQLTVHGVSYTRNYFDFSYNNYQYSYVRYATDNGYAVFNIDRIGNGESSRPDGALVNIQNSAYTLHQLIQKLRNGTLIGQAFSEIIYVGHSYGSYLAVELAAAYPNDVDGIVLTGYLHNINPAALLAAPTAIIPANLDPKFGLLFPLNYITTVAGKRAVLFYNTALSDPAVIAQDENEKDVFSVTALPDIILAISSNTSYQITKPVQIVIGENDFLFCGGSADCSNINSLTAIESPKFNTDLTISIIEDAGHDLNLHTNYLSTYSAINNWISARF